MNNRFSPLVTENRSPDIESAIKNQIKQNSMYRFIQIRVYINTYIDEMDSGKS